MPNIREMLLKLEGFEYAMLLDLIMGYYHISISKKASNICTIILPWGRTATNSSVYRSGLQYPQAYPL